MCAIPSTVRSATFRVNNDMVTPQGRTYYTWLESKSGLKVANSSQDKCRYTVEFGSRSTLQVGSQQFEIYRLNAVEARGCSASHLPYSLCILLENLLRREDGKSVKADDIRALTAWNKKSVPSEEIAFMPSRVLLQDFTGVPAVVDLAAMRDAMKALGGDPGLINPLQPAELVIDHSVQVDEFGSPKALQLNAELEFSRNKERYAFLRWGQTAFKNFAIVPPDTGICHQVNLEYLARVVFVGAKGESGHPMAYPDTLVGTDSHTTMINGLGVLGWGVGGIEAEAAMLGQPVSMLIPQVVGVRLSNQLKEGSTATDLVLTVTEMLRKKGVVGKFVEFFGPGLHNLPLADRATIANMAPEYGATCGIFPVDDETLRYLRLSGRTWRPSRRTTRSRACSIRQPRQKPSTLTCSISTLRPWNRALPGQNVRRTGFHCRERPSRSSRRCQLC